MCIDNNKIFLDPDNCSPNNIIDNKDFKEKNEALHEKYTKLDESYTALLKRNRKV